VNGAGIAVPHRDPITRGYPGPDQLLRQCACGVVELTPRQRRAVVVDVGGTFREPLGIAGYCARQRQI
jgi:hypothetical protein